MSDAMLAIEPVPMSKRNLSPLPSSTRKQLAACPRRAAGADLVLAELLRPRVVDVAVGGGAGGRGDGASGTEEQDHPQGRSYASDEPHDGSAMHRSLLTDRVS
jgi:hypothetical protein